jgi:hypothetical protein
VKKVTADRLTEVFLAYLSAKYGQIEAQMRVIAEKVGVKREELVKARDSVKTNILPEKEDMPARMPEKLPEMVPDTDSPALDPVPAPAAATPAPEPAPSPAPEPAAAPSQPATGGSPGEPSRQ